jgi:serine/threonine-protein kinase
MVFYKSSKQYLCRGCGENNDLKSPPNSETRCSCGRKLGLLVGDSPYFLLKRLGDGGFGSVYQAHREQDTKSSYAVKIFKKGKIKLDCLQDSLNKEIEGLKTLQKFKNVNVRVPKYIAHSFPASESEGDFVIVLEFIDGDNLLQELERRKEHKTDGNLIIFKEEEIIILLIDLLETIDIIHTVGKILHRDIKPQNIVRRTSDKKLYLVDFGSSKVLNDNAEYTEVVFQTPAYAPPERSKDVDKGKAGLSEFVNQENLERYKHTRDLYSLAITIAYLITGESCNTNRKDPFPNEDWEKWMRDVCKKAPKLGIILKRMLSFYPSDRYQSALEVLLIVRTIAWKIHQGDEWLIKGWLLGRGKAHKQFKGTNDFLIESSVQDFLKASQEHKTRQDQKIIEDLLKKNQPQNK